MNKWQNFQFLMNFNPFKDHTFLWHDLLQQHKGSIAHDMMKMAQGDSFCQ